MIFIMSRNIQLYGDLDENDIAGASLGEMNVEDLDVKKLQRWLKCRKGASTKGRKNDLIERVKLYISNGWDKKYLYNPEGHCPKVYSKSVIAAYELEVETILHSPPKSGYTTSLQDVPIVDESDIYQYFLIRSEYNDASAAKHKDGGWNMFRSQKVLKIELKFCDNVNLITLHAVIEKSYDRGVITGVTKKKYDVYVILEKHSGTVLGGKCDCKAPHGFCKHVAAALYSLFEYQRRGSDFLPVERTRTSQTQKWHQPGVQAATCLKFDQLDFSAFNLDRDISQEKKEQKDYKSYLSCPQGMNCLSRDKVEKLSDSLKAMGRAHHLVAALESNDYEPVRKQRKVNVKFSDTQQPLDQVPAYHAEHAALEDDINLDYTLTDRCHSFYSSHVLVDKKMALEISMATKGQCKNDRWKKERSVRLTASGFHAIVTRKKRDVSKLIEGKIKNKQFTNRYTRWGLQGEHVAIAAYKAQKSREGYDVKAVDDLGLVINPAFPYLGASLDGYVTLQMDGKVEHGAVEIKTLAKHASLTLAQAAEVKDMFFTYKDNALQVDRSHKYYHQVQGQLFIAGLDWCDLFIWTPQSSGYERIYKDKTLWAIMLPKLSDFYFQHFLPALASTEHTHADGSGHDI